MNVFIKNINEKYALEILSWRYDEPYDFYNNDLTNDSLQELLENKYYVVVDHDDELVGFFCIGKSAHVPAGYLVNAYNEDMIDVGFGMKPELTGRGLGYEFCSIIFRYVQETINGSYLRLTVATFNRRAIHLYEKLGFVRDKTFSTDAAAFITMVRRMNEGE